jgi:hypothetical protein
MSDDPQPRIRPTTDGPAAMRAARSAQTPERADTRHGAPHSAERGQDPVTDWLLQRDDLANHEFNVLFAIHKLRARPRAGGWVDQATLCRCAGLAPVALGCILKALRRRGLIWSAPHPVKAGYSRYLLLVQ